MNLTNTYRLSVKGRLRVAAVGLGVGAMMLGLTTITSSAASNPGFTLYSAQGYDQASVTAFNATHPGFTVTLNDNSTGPLLQQIQAEGKNPKWGVLWVDGAAAFAQLDREGLLVHHSVPRVNFNALGRQNVPSDGSFTPTGLTVVGALCYDSSKLSPSQLPKTWQQLTASKFRGALGMNDPSQSGPTYPLIAGLMAYLGHYRSGSPARAVAAGEAYFGQLKTNGLVVNPTNGQTISAMEAQTISMAIVQSSACYGAKLTSFPSMRVAFLNPSIALPSVIGIDAKQPPIVRADAQKFVDWVLSPAGQRVMQTGDPQGDSLFWPVLNGERPSNKIIPNLNTTHAMSINPYVWGPLEARVNTWFDANIVNG